mgnify:FL=1
MPVWSLLVCTLKSRVGQRGSLDIVRTLLHTQNICTIKVNLPMLSTSRFPDTWEFLVCREWIELLMTVPYWLLQNLEWSLPFWSRANALLIRDTHHRVYLLWEWYLWLCMRLTNNGENCPDESIEPAYNDHDYDMKLHLSLVRHRPNKVIDCYVPLDSDSTQVRYGGTATPEHNHGVQRTPCNNNWQNFYQWIYVTNLFIH